NYGLYSECPTLQMEGCFLQDLAGKVGMRSMENIKITKETYPNQTYRMFPPAACEEVENPEITDWSYTVTSDYIELNNNDMMCNEGCQACLLILSAEETLTGANLPVDGREYTEAGTKIGSSLFVVKGDVVKGTLFWGGKVANRTASGLTPGTTYYLHAFPYVTDCAGVRYNTTNIPHRAITTAIAPVNSVSVDEASITENGFTLNIDKGDAERYVLAVSHRQISPFAKIPLSAKEGGHKVGDKLIFAYSDAEVSERYELEVLAVGTDAQYKMVAQPNTDYYFYVWSTDASQSKFSFDVRTCGVATPYLVPAVFAFDSAARTPMTPAGWTLPTTENGKSFLVVEPIGQKLLTARCYADSQAPLRIEAISPVIKGGASVAVTTELYFWKMPSNGLEPVNASLRDGDTVYIQYKGLSENAWTTLSAVTKADVLAGRNTITTEGFYLLEDFQLRYLAVTKNILAENSTEGYPNISILSVRVGIVCRKISSDPEVSQIMQDRATLSWEDDDNTPRAEAYHLRYRLSENDAWTGRIARNRSYTFPGLKDNTTYTMEVAAVCSAGDTSDYVNVSFTTLRGLPYKFALASKPGSTNPDTLPEGVTLKTGALPASGTASLSEPDAEKTVWAPMQKTNVYGAGLTVDASMNNPLWLNLPVISTGVSRGKARLSFKLSAWSEADAAQAATFGATDTLWVLCSADNKFNGTNAKIKVNLSEVTPQGKTFTFDFEVENAYHYWAVYTNLKTTGNVLFIDSLKIEWTDLYCNAATNLRQSNLSHHSVDISWTGEGMEYGIVYNNRKTDKWDTVYTYETTYTFDNLIPGTPYQYYIIVYCDADRLKMSEKSAIRYFITEEYCDVPTIEIVAGSETWHGVTVVTQSDEKTREFRIDPKDNYGIGWNAKNGDKDTTRIHGLVELHEFGAITYFIKVRAICPNDTSAWSESKEFTTLPPPPCGMPTDLKAKVNEATKTATLSWTAGENNLTYRVVYRAGSALRSDTLYSSYPSCTINNIRSNVVYTWSVRSYCERPLACDSAVEGNRFGTNVGTESVQGFDKAIKVRVFESQIIIENNEGLYIKSLQAFSTDGRLLKTYPVNSDQNAYIYHNLPKGAALLRVLGENGKTATHKTIIL
ncbi:MAG: fibronectin type III domain-containing protein, partial [Bacteroidales bacterium]|nr:fibronectin type III domain-containing protein [Bacteroidales bacterium]